MALQVIGAGFGRTGTLSLYTALNSLGLPSYHMVEVLRNRANRHHLAFCVGSPMANQVSSALE
jgi:hypothetical protein